MSIHFKLLIFKGFLQIKFNIENDMAILWSWKLSILLPPIILFLEPFIIKSSFTIVESIPEFSRFWWMLVSRSLYLNLNSARSFIVVTPFACDAAIANIGYSSIK